ncbi:MAG: hypothetical protein EOO17_01700 [Chloroflexi bacterium]|nr:MAG: hypothetical protein EOO17_01700 [Chloroflexota bacterium]
MSERGVFIAIEGGDGSGKATQSEHLNKHLSSRLGERVLKTTFPRYTQDSAVYAERYLNGEYGPADSVSADLASLAFAIDRYAGSHDIRDHLATGSDAVVISDRYMGSNLAHQGTKISDPSERKEFYERTLKTEYEVLGIPRPDINVVLLVPTDLAQANVDKKDARSYTLLKRDVHEADASHLDRAKLNYEELCLLYPDEFTPIVCIDEHGQLRTIEDIQMEIREKINQTTRLSI